MFGGRWQALALSLLMPGMGQLFMGRAWLGFAFFLIPNLLLIYCYLFTSAPGVLLGLLLFFLLYFAASLEAFRVVMERRVVRRQRWFNHPPVLFLFWCLHLSVPLLLTRPDMGLGKHAVVRAFKAGSSMVAPSLLEGDLFFAAHPRKGSQPGDVVVIRVPGLEPGDRYRLRRWLAGPGQRVAIRAGQVYIDGEALLLEPLDDPGLLARFHRGSGHEIRPDQLKLELIQERRHAVLVVPTALENLEEVSLKSDQAFVLPDQRVPWADQRVWGIIALDQVVGRAEWIVWPKGSFSRFGKLHQDY